MSWEVVEMRSFLSERKGRYKPDDKAISGLQRIDKIDFSGNIFLSEKPSKTDMILIKQGDLVISGINVEKGAMSIYKDEKDVIATIHYSSYEYDTEKIDIDFLRHFLKSPEFIEALKEQVPGGIKTEIKPKHILPLKVCIPTDVEEQREVVAFLDQQNKTLETQSTELTHQLELVKQLRQAFLREAMQGKLIPQDPNDEPASVLLEKIKSEKERLIKEKKIKKQKSLLPISEDEIPFEIPENWVWCKLGEISDFISGNNFRSGDFSKGDGAKCIKITNAGIQEIVETDDVLPSSFIEKYPQYLVYEGDLVLALTRPYISNGLKISQCPSSYNMSLLNQRVAVIRPYLDDLKDYTYSFLKSDYILNHYKGMFAGKGQQPNLRKDHVTDLFFPLAPLFEQQRIVTKLNELMQYCDDLEESIKKSQEQNELLLQQVLFEALEPKEKEVEKV
jgi:type I restriction enzyme S subunit